MRIRLMLADDHELVRSGIIKLLKTSLNIEVVAESSCREELFDTLRAVEVDVLLLGMVMPPIKGADMIARIKSDHPDLRVLVLSMFDDILIALRAMKAGASGYITTYGNPQELFGAVHKVAVTGRYLNPEMAEKLAFVSTVSGGRELELLLSDRERQIMSRIVEGKCIKTIANELSISDKTVSTHKAHILAKLGVHNVPDLVRYVMKNESPIQYPHLAVDHGNGALQY
ncbi:MAG TPA: response regulator transcription factor [Gallionella sp.]|nr:response regulator transcription factor [Gallionella sp.]